MRIYVGQFVVSHNCAKLEKQCNIIYIRKHMINNSNKKKEY